MNSIIDIYYQLLDSGTFSEISVAQYCLEIFDEQNQKTRFS